MKTLSWDNAVAAIVDAYACVVDDNELLYMGEDGDDLYLDTESTGEHLHFTGSDNKKVQVTDDGQLLLIDQDKVEYKIGLIVRKPIRGWIWESDEAVTNKDS
jgi:hypothetical protein